MVSCGKRGSLLVAGAANIVAATQAPGAAMVSDEIQTEAECMISSVAFFIGEERLVQPRVMRQPQALQVSPSDRNDVGEALLRDRHASFRMPGLADVEIEREHRPVATLLDPADQPKDGLPTSAPSRPVLNRIVASPTFVTDRISRTRSWLRFETGSTPRRRRSTKSICCMGSMRRFPVSQNWSMPPPMSRLPYSNRSRYFCIRSCPIRRGISL